MRTALAWILGFAVLVAIGVAFMFLGHLLGVPSSIELDGPTTVTFGGGRGSYDEEVDSLQTMFGYASGGVAFVVALWAGQASYAGTWRAGFTKKGWFTFFAWLMALTILVVVSILVHLAFKSFTGAFAGYARMFVELGAAAGVGWACYQWWKVRVNQLSVHEKFSQETPSE